MKLKNWCEKKLNQKLKKECKLIKLNCRYKLINLNICYINRFVNIYENLYILRITNHKLLNVLLAACCTMLNSIRLLTFFMFVHR